jgi:hypothetical protein
MKYSYNLILLTTILLLSVKGFSSEPIPDSTTINFLRNEFYAAVEDEKKTYALEKYIINKYSDNFADYGPVILAYYGAIQTLKAKHAFNPVSKLSHLISGLNRLEEAVAGSPDNLEIRFMRFSILDHVPTILGYSREIEADKDKICVLLLQKDYSSLSREIQEGMAEYMLASDRLTDDEKSQVQDLISSITRK